MAVAQLKPAAARDGSDWRDDLFAVIKARSFRRGRFTLASGRESELYFNMKPTMMDPRGACLAARAMLDQIHEEKADFAGGLALGAVPTLGAVAALGWLEGRPIPTFFVRQKAKDHGTRETIEGLGPDDSLVGKRVVVVDDVATTGGSILLAIEAARAAGAIVEVGLVIVDREEGAEALLRERDVRLRSIFRAGAFL
ncbi:MAG: orotate phosphoribosyltransferase [Caulobacteraceae bacterium]|nr:orotate phosphoribosyltransferase [Caulobacteraceae bacterium]